MTDPVDTNKLRELQALSGGILSRNLLEGSGVWKINREITRALGHAADEVDRLRAFKVGVEAVRRAQYQEQERLRAVIENAPHAHGNGGYWCTAGLEEAPCTCWKADAL